MITTSPTAFLDAHAALAPLPQAAATARAAFMVAPAEFALAQESARDNRYMDLSLAVDPLKALAQHAALAQALRADVPVITFPGDPATPDAVFPNNVFATARVAGEARLIVGRMRHEVRQREAGRRDIRGFFRDTLGYAEVDLSGQPHPCELTGALVIDRARGIGFCGLSERCDEAGARLMHEAFGLRAIVLPDIGDSLDGHLIEAETSSLTIGGTPRSEIEIMGESTATLVVGPSLTKAANILKARTGVPDYRFQGLMGLDDCDASTQALAEISGKPVPEKIERQRAQLQDAMVDCHFMMGFAWWVRALRPSRW